MSNRQVLCFKLSYSLGVTEEMLRSMYPSLFPFVEDLHYLDNKPNTKRYRVLTRCYYMLIRHYDVYRKAKRLDDVASDGLLEFAAELKTDVDIEELFRVSNNLDEVINAFSREANNLLNLVYQEMEFGLCFSDFFTLMHLPILSRLQILQVQFVLRKVPSVVNIYFFAHELLNIECKNMLMSDTYLVRRLALVTGAKQGRVQDMSALGIALRKQDDSSFLRYDDVPSFRRVLVDTYSIPAADRLLPQVIVEGIRELSYCKDCDACVQQVSEHDTPEDVLIITRRTEEKLDAMTGVMRHATFLVPMPIPRGTYRRILRKAWKNVYLLSPREGPDSL